MEAKQHLEPGTQLQGGKYEIVRFISSGGFGCTYEGVYPMMKSRVAIKEFFVKDFCGREDTGDISVLTRGELVSKLYDKFLDEARALFNMHHAGLVRVTDIFEERGTAYYVMDYIDGESLHAMVKQRGPLPEAEAVGYIRQVASALSYVHEQNRLHLDIKPGNIMVDSKGTARLIDFGASKHYSSETGENTSTMMAINTPGYAPVEQCTQTVTTFSPATDIYALGATLYKIVTGNTPPEAATLLSEEGELSIPGHVSAATRNAILMAMKPKRKERPQTVEAWLRLMDAKVDNEATIIDMPPAPPKLPKTPATPPVTPKPTPAPATPVAPKPVAETPKKKKNGKLVAGIVAGAVVLTILIIIGVCAAFSGSSSYDDYDYDNGLHLRRQ